VQKKPEDIWLLNSKTWQLIAPSGAALMLTMREQIAMKLVMASPGVPVSRDVLAKAWGFQPLIYDFRRMESTVRRLRNKCEQQLGCPLPLVTVYSHGFVLKHCFNLNNLKATRAATSGRRLFTQIDSEINRLHLAILINIFECLATTVAAALSACSAVQQPGLPH